MTTGVVLALSVAIRVIRCAVLTIRNAVTIAISASPVAVRKLPTTIALNPCRLVVVIATAFSYPGASYPLVVLVSPAPVSLIPYITRTMLGNNLFTWRWRCDSHNDHGICQWGDTSKRYRKNHGENSFFHHGFHLTFCLTNYLSTVNPLHGMYAGAHTLKCNLLALSSLPS